MRNPQEVKCFNCLGVVMTFNIVLNIRLLAAVEAELSSSLEEVTEQECTDC